MSQSFVLICSRHQHCSAWQIPFPVSHLHIDSLPELHTAVCSQRILGSQSILVFNILINFSLEELVQCKFILQIAKKNILNYQLTKVPSFNYPLHYLQNLTLLQSCTHLWLHSALWKLLSHLGEQGCFMRWKLQGILSVSIVD